MLIVPSPPLFKSAGATTVFGPRTLGGSDSGWAGYTVVVQLPAALLSAASGSQVRLTMNYGNVGNGTTVKVYFGQAAGAGDTYDFSGTQVNILFSGVDFVGSGAAANPVSDWITLGESYDESVRYLVAIHNVSTYTYEDSVTGTTPFYLFGDEAATTNKSGGYGTWTANRLMAVETVEIQ
jgi:hypothetical protein